MANVATMASRETRMPNPGTSINVTTALDFESSKSKPRMVHIEDHPQWSVVARIPITLSAAIALPGFRVRDLMALKIGQMVHSHWSSVEDIPLKVNSAQLSWCEFEVVEQRLAVRITRLA